MSREKQERVLALLDDIRRICVLQHRTVTDIREQEWHLYLDTPEHETAGVRLFAGRDESGSEILLEVRRPSHSPCPPLPESLTGWIATPHWDDFRVDEVEVRPEMEKATEQMGRIVMRFHDSERRARDFPVWRKARIAWRKKERMKQQAQHLFDELYRMYGRCRRDAGNLELVMGNGFFFSGLDAHLHHPLLLTRVRVRYAAGDCMQIIDGQGETEFYSEFFRGQEGIDEESLRVVERNVGMAGLHPLQRDLGERFLKDMASALSSKCRYAAKEFRILPTDWYILYERPVLFLRRRHSGEDKLLTGIMERVAEQGDTPLPLLDIAEGKRQGQRGPAGSESLADARGEAENLLLVKAANAEQLGIVRKLAESPAVVVQGPPGTGKTHTIANLLGHFLAQGNRVLVTSSTRKALRVLKDKLPEGIRNLCVSLQGDSYRDMERSVEGICAALGRSGAEEMEKEGQELRRKWEEARRMLCASREKVYALQRMERQKDFFTYEGEGYSLSQMARFVHAHERLLELIPGKIGEGKPIPLSGEELALLYGSNGLFSRRDLVEMAENLPRSSRLLSAVDARNLLRNREILGERERGLLQELPEWSVHEERVFYRHEQVVADFVVDAFLAAEADYRGIDFAWMDSAWAREAVLAGRQGGTARMAWEQLGKDIERVSERKDAAVVPLLGRSVECPEEYLLDEQALEDLAAMREVFSARGGLPFFQRLLHGRWRRIAREILVDGHPLRSGEDCSLAERYLALQQARKRVQQEWDHLLGRCGEPSYEELDESADDVDDICSARWEQIRYCLDWYDRHRASFQKHLSEAGVRLDKILPEDERFMTPRQQMAMEIHWLRESWPQCAALIRLECMEKQELMEDFRKRVAELAGRRSSLARRLATALQSGSGEAYRRDYDQLLHYESLMDKFRERTELLAKLASVAPDWAAAIARQQGSSGMAEVPAALEDAWKCRQFLQQLAKVRKEDVPGGSISLHQQMARLHEITAGLVEKLAWQHFFREVEEGGRRAALMSWSKAVRKAGKNAGKNISRRIRMARKQTMEIQAAVPVWIMPLDEVWENLRPESRKFDVVIIDEASQADVTALPLFYFGRKVIVVGDDKQVSPAPMELSGEDIWEERPYAPDSSLYDIARMYFETRMLKEHFRSLPEIIGYSNRLAYDNLIQPLRESGGCVLKPVISYEVEGVRDGNRQMNWMEAEEIVVLMLACMEQPEYADKTFGAISLRGEEQGRLIREIALRRIGIPRLEERHFLAGSPVDFQGDERDVVFLSMVDDVASAKDESTFLMDGQEESLKRSYNVAASRARDQLWVLHSMDAEDLEEGDIRRGLLEYAAAPEEYAEPIAGKRGDVAPMFHREVAKLLRQRGFHVEEQWPVGSCRIALAVLSPDRRVAISCEGEDGYGKEELLEAQRKQAVLERLGWVFLRLWGSEFYRSPDKAMDRMQEELVGYGVFPEGQTEVSSSMEKARSELLARVMETAARIREEWRNEDLPLDGNN